MRRGLGIRGLGRRGLRGLSLCRGRRVHGLGGEDQLGGGDDREGVADRAIALDRPLHAAFQTFALLVVQGGEVLDELNLERGVAVVLLVERPGHADVLGEDRSGYRVFIRNYSLNLTCGLKPSASVQVEIDGILHQETAAGDGQYDAFMKALRKVYESLGTGLPLLTDYEVSIPPGGKTDALVETVIRWNHNGREFRTRGLDADQTESAIKATEKMLNIICSNETNHEYTKLIEIANEL